MRPATALILFAMISASARGDIVPIASTVGADAESGAFGTNYLPTTGTTIGGGQETIQFHHIVSDVSFDLSSLHGTIVGLELTGSVTSLSTVVNHNSYDPSFQYAELGVNLTLPGSVDLANAQSIYNGVTGGQSVGGFSVDNSVPNGLPFPNNFGSTFAVSLGPSAIAAAQQGSLSLGFDPTVISPFTQYGVAGTLSVQLVAEVVPEPTSLCLTGLGMSLLGLVKLARSVQARRVA